jgi:hypothetical protein
MRTQFEMLSHILNFPKHKVAISKTLCRFQKGLRLLHFYTDEPFQFSRRVALFKAREGPIKRKAVYDQLRRVSVHFYANVLRRWSARAQACSQSHARRMH